MIDSRAQLAIGGGRVLHRLRLQMTPPARQDGSTRVPDVLA